MKSTRKKRRSKPAGTNRARRLGKRLAMTTVKSVASGKGARPDNSDSFSDKLTMNKDSAKDVMKFSTSSSLPMREISNLLILLSTPIDCFSSSVFLSSPEYLLPIQDNNGK